MILINAFPSWRTSTTINPRKMITSLEVLIHSLWVEMGASSSEQIDVEEGNLGPVTFLHINILDIHQYTSPRMPNKKPTNTTFLASGIPDETFICYWNRGRSNPGPNGLFFISWQLLPGERCEILWLKNTSGSPSSFHSAIPYQVQSRKSRNRERTEWNLTWLPCQFHSFSPN